MPPKKQATINKFFQPDTASKPAQPTAEEKGKQTLLTKFFTCSSPAEGKFEYLFQREEARRKQLQEQQEKLRLAQENDEKKQRRDLRKQQREQRKLKYEEEQQSMMEEQRQKFEGRVIIPGLYLGSRLAAKNYDWLDGNVTAILNVSMEVKNYCEGEFVSVLKKSQDSESTEDQKQEEKDKNQEESNAPELPTLSTEQAEIKDQETIAEPVKESEPQTATESSDVMETNEQNEEGKNLVTLTYKRISIEDSAEARLIYYFDEIAEFIHANINEQCGVLVHCREGLSRSPTSVVAYLMKMHGWNLKKAYEHVDDCSRKLRINDGFKRQLMEYELKLFKEQSIDFFDRRTRNGTTRTSAAFSDLQQRKAARELKKQSLADSAPQDEENEDMDDEEKENVADNIPNNFDNIEPTPCGNSESTLIVAFDQQTVNE